MHNIKGILSFCLLLGLWFGVVPVYAVDGVAKHIPVMQQAAILDGNLDEIVWQQALKVPISYEVEPAENKPAHLNSYALIYENGNSLYVAFVAEDPQANSIRAYLSDRDDINASDRVSITLDTFNDSRRAFEFSVNPLGIQQDAIIDEQTDTHDDSWDAIWYSAGKLTASGYQVEIQIPFNALRFADSPNDKTWGFEVARVWPRQQEHIFLNQPRDRNISCKLCQMAKLVGFKNVDAPTNLTLIPALTLVDSQSRELAGDYEWQGDGTEERASLDLRWGINQNTFLNATVNPDYSQVEADALQLDINNLSTLFLTEKRPFFLDGIDYFNNWSRLVYTRIFEEPEYGIKLTGKSNGHSYGLMSLQDKHTNILIPDEYGTQLFSLRDIQSENLLLRYKYDLSDTGNIGTTVTHRKADGYANTLVSLDGKFWFSQQDYFKFQLMSSDSDYPQEILSLLPGLQENVADEAITLKYQHASRDWEWALTYFRFGEDFRADAGYVSVSNWQRNAVNLSRKWYSAEESWWSMFRIDSAVYTTEEIDGTDIEDRFQVNFEVNGIYESAIGLDLIEAEQTYIEPAIQNQPQRLFDIQRAVLWGEFNPVADLGVEFSYTWGDDIDFATSRAADVKTLVSVFDYQVSRSTNTELEYISETLDTALGQAYQVQLANLRLAYQLNEKSFIRLTLQARNTQLATLNNDLELLASQLIYSYKANPFTLVYFGYSDKYLTDINSADLEKTDKTLFFKFSYAWQL